MGIPFTTDQFFDAFRRYNEAVWPAQWVLGALAVITVVVALRHGARAARWVNVVLALLWYWMAIAYHLAIFADLSRLGLAFALAFVVQGAMFSWLAVRRAPASYVPRSLATTGIGAVLIIYAIVVYPMLGYLWGHRYPASPTFGVPCPTTIYTLGLLVWGSATVPRRFYLIPLAWAVVGTSAAVNLGVTEDFGLAVAAALTIGLLVARRSGTRRRESVTDHRPAIGVRPSARSKALSRR